MKHYLLEDTTPPKFACGDSATIPWEAVTDWKHVDCPACLALKPGAVASPVHFIYKSRHGPRRDYFECDTNPNKGRHTAVTNWERVTCPGCLERRPKKIQVLTEVPLQGHNNGGWAVHFFKCEITDIECAGYKSLEDVDLYDMREILELDVVPNLGWIVPMQLDRHLAYPITIHERAP